MQCMLVKNRLPYSLGCYYSILDCLVGCSTLDLSSTVGVISIDCDPHLIGDWFFVDLALLDSCSHNLHPPLGLGLDYIAPVIDHIVLHNKHT